MTANNTEDTIFALATAQGMAGVAVIRVSGPQAAAAVIALTGAAVKPRSVALRALKHPHTQDLLDRAMVLWMPAPHSFTGEDVAEFQTHGSRAVVKAVLSALSCVEGCRPAQAGEFTRRSLLNGKLSLDQVEALGDLLVAETERQRRLAIGHLEGRLMKEVGAWVEHLSRALAMLEAAIDFSEEDDISSQTIVQARSDIVALAEKIALALEESRHCSVLRDGLRVAIIGRPNMGKSTLLNALSGEDIAITSPIAGTTRDTVEAVCDLNGFRIRFIDTAGLRETADPVEAEGIRRSLRAKDSADLTLVLDSDPKHLSELMQSRDADKSVLVLSKCDEPAHRTFEFVEFSVQRPETLKNLQNLIVTHAERLTGHSEPLLTHERQRNLCHSALNHLQQAMANADWTMSVDVVAAECHEAMQDLSEMTGRHGIESVLDRLFSSFCIGK